MSSTSYRIELRGWLSDAILGPYADEFVVSRTTNRTVLAGTVRDPAHLHGIVSHLTSLGLELIGVGAMGSTEREEGRMAGAYAMAQLVAAPLLGRFGDKRGRRPVVLVGVTGYVIAPWWEV